MDALPTESSAPLDFNERIAQVRPQLRAYLLSLTASLTTAEDLTQETSVILWRKRAEFDPEGNFKAWAFRIAFLQAQNFRRKEGRRLRLELPLDETFNRLAAPLPAVGTKNRDALLHCLDRLPEDHRELLLRRYQDGDSLELLSSQESTNRNALAQKLFRLKKALIICISKRSAKS